MYSERGQRPLPELRPYPGQVDVALRLVHLRRRRSAALAASAAGLAVVASLLVTARGSGLAVVEPADPHPLPSAASPTAAVLALPGSAPLGEGPRTLTGPETAAPAPPSAAAVPPRLASPGLRPPSARPPAEARRREPVRRHPMRKPGACAAAPGHWCGYVLKTAMDDVPWFQLVACNPAGATPTNLSFEHEREVDYAIVDTATGDEVWRWSSVEPEPAENPHSISAEAGWCYVWTAVWNGLGDDGRPLPPGEYVVRGEVLGQPGSSHVSDPWQVG